MAYLLETLRNSILDSIKGRKIGLNPAGYLAGPQDLLRQVEDISTTAATSASPYGITRVLTAGSSVTSSHTLQAPPYPSIRKTLALNSTSTGGQQFTATNATIYTATDGTTTAVVNLFAPGAVVTLLAVTTDRWLVESRTGSSATPLVTFTTST